MRLVLASLLLLACNTPEVMHPMDANDLGVPARKDLGAPDPGSPDFGPPDLGPTDTGSLDLGPQDTGASPLLIAPPPAVFIEREPQTLTIQAQSSARVFAQNLPPGARWDEAQRILRWTPDFTQGGDTHHVQLIARDGDRAMTVTATITVMDSIAPPAPIIVSDEPQDGFRLLRLSQQTDAFLDSPGRAGRTFDAVIAAPLDAAQPKPVRIRLHGFGGQPATEGWEGEFRIMPHDPNNTYWWGFTEDAPNGSNGALLPYTQRRILHLLEWVLRRYPGADRQRVYVEGGSMGGTGAIMFGLHHARHVAWVESFIGQTISRNHRPSRIAQLTPLWGAPSAAWDAVDATALLMNDPLAREQFIFSKHGKDDPTIHFGAVTFASPLTQLSYYDALQASHTGHMAVWDEGAHGPVDPVLGFGWWHQGWNPIFDDTSQLRRDAPFVAFSSASHDDDPGAGEGNGLVPFSAESGYAGDVNVPGDTGWDGAIAGVINRHLRWDSTRAVDELDRFELPLRVLDDAGQDPPSPGYPPSSGYPPSGDRLGAPLPVRVDVTPRRVRGFVTRPGETVAWTFGDQRGEVQAAEDGSVTVPDLALDTAWRTLVLVRR